MESKKVSEEHEAYKSRGMKAGKGGEVGKPESQPMPKEESKLSSEKK